MGRLLDGLKDAEYNPHTAVCKLPQPFRMLDKLLSRLVDDAVNLAVERDEARLAARGIAEGTEVLAPSAVVDDIGAVTSVSTSRDGAWAFVGNEDGELVVVNVQRGSVASKTKVLAGSIAAVDAVAVDPPPPPPPRHPRPLPRKRRRRKGRTKARKGRASRKTPSRKTKMQSRKMPPRPRTPTPPRPKGCPSTTSPPPRVDSPRPTSRHSTSSRSRVQTESSQSSP